MTRCEKLEKQLKAYAQYLKAWSPPTRDQTTGELVGTWTPCTYSEFLSVLEQCGLASDEEVPSGNGT